MKISKTKFHQIIREEVTSLVEAPIPPTKMVRRKGPKERRADREREVVKGFFGSDDPLVTKAEPGTSPPDPDKTVEVPPEVRAARGAKEKELAVAKLATHRSLHDPKRISITTFDVDVRDDLIKMYEEKEGITVDNTPLGSGEFGIVYKGENPEYGPVAVKFTLSGQEINAYRNIKKLKDGLESRDPEIGNVLPTIISIVEMVSPPVAPTRNGNMVASPGGEKYKIFVVQMELLEKLDPNIRSDVFGPAAYEEYPPEVRQRFVNEYLTVENIYSSLEKLMGDMRWEKVLNAIEGDPGPVTEVSQGVLPIKDKRAFPPFREIDKLLPRLREAYLDADAENHFFALQDIHKILATKIGEIFSRYIDDENLSAGVRGVAGYMLPQQMAANTKLPQYDPEAIEAKPGLRASILPPSELQTTVAKNFYGRLKKLEKYDSQYGDVHPNNLMMRENGDLVVADVGLFLFGPKGGRGYAGTIAERFKQLAGII